MRLQKKIFISLCLVFAISLLAAPAISHAQTDALEKLKKVGEKAYGVPIGEEPKSVAEIIGGVISTFLTLLGVVAVILILYGGYLWMTARGKEERLTKAKETIEAAIIGLVIILAAYGISYFVIREITKAAQ